MATFGQIGSPNANVLFDPGAALGQAAAIQRNQIMAQQAVEDRAINRLDREREQVGRVAASLLSLSPEARPQAYATARAEMQRAGIGSRRRKSIRAMRRWSRWPARQCLPPCSSSLRRSSGRAKR